MVCVYQYMNVFVYIINNIKCSGLVIDISITRPLHLIFLTS